MKELHSAKLLDLFRRAYQAEPRANLWWGDPDCSHIGLIDRAVARHFAAVSNPLPPYWWPTCKRVMRDRGYA